MKTSRFNSLIHAPNRLHICAILSTSGEMEFKLLRDRLDVSDSVLSKHLKSLEEADYVAPAKKTDFGRQRTWLSLTPKGVAAYTAHVKELKRIVG